MPIGAPPRQTPTRKEVRNPLLRTCSPSSKESCNSDCAEMKVFWMVSGTMVVLIAKRRSASLVFQRLRPDGIQPLLSPFTRGNACLEVVAIADHGREGFEHQHCARFRGRHLDELRRCAGTESALAIFVLGAALGYHEVAKTELTARTRDPQVHVRRGRFEA